MNKFIKIGEVIINTDNISTVSANLDGVLIVMNNGSTVRLDMEGYVSIKSSLDTKAWKVHEKCYLTSPARLWELLLYATEPCEAKPDKLPHLSE